MSVYHAREKRHHLGWIGSFLLQPFRSLASLLCVLSETILSPFPTVCILTERPIVRQDRVSCCSFRALSSCHLYQVCIILDNVRLGIPSTNVFCLVWPSVYPCRVVFVLVAYPVALLRWRDIWHIWSMGQEKISLASKKQKIRKHICKGLSRFPPCHFSVEFFSC